MKKEFSFVINLFEDTENPKKSIDSIINQKYDLSKIEIIVIYKNYPEIENLKEYYKEYKNIIFEKAQKEDCNDMYNKALKYISGNKVNFINGCCYLENENTLNTLEMYNEFNLIAINTGFYDSDLETRTNYIMQPKKNTVINLVKKPNELALNLIGYFINVDLLKNLKFVKNYNLESNIKLLIDLFYKETEIKYFNDIKITSILPFEDNTSKNAIQYQESWYIDSLKNYYNEIKNLDNIPVYLQEIIMYLIYAKINTNINHRDKGILKKEDFPTFVNILTNILGIIDDETILQKKQNSEQKKVSHKFKFPRWVIMWFLNLKYDYLESEKKEYLNDNKLFFNYFKNRVRISKVDVANLSKQKINISTINYKKNKIYFDCTTTVKDVFSDDEIKIIIKDNDQPINIKKTNVYPLLKIFGRTIARKYPFKFEIELNENTKNIEAFLVYNNQEIQMQFNFTTVHAKLNNSKRSFWHFDKYIIKNNINKLIIEKYSLSKLLKYEILFCVSKLKNEKNKKRAMKLVFLRMLYYLTKPILGNKHIWLTWDKLFKAGDNGEYMYQYGLTKDKNIYYIVKKDAPDYKRLKKQNAKHVLIYNTLKAKLYSLHSEVILATHANIISYCGFEGISRNYVSNLFTPEVICIQHGLTIQQIAQYQNRLFDNIKLYCCASKYEVENIKEDFYDYDSSQIKLTGLARYDGLKNNDKKIILITPTWRRNVVNSSVAHIKKTHNNNFKKSEYYKIYNNLINNKDLIKCANDTGYKIIYLLHPAMSGQLEDFDRNDFVDIIAATSDINYEKILTESSLMVTDYSGVQFDFAYQRKPIVYYHPETLPPHYDEGGLNYEKMGFGPICRNEKEIIHELCDYMKNNCQIKEKYKNNADDFFAFSDFRNRERILNEIDKYMKEK